MVKIGDSITPQLVDEIVNQVMPPPVTPLTPERRKYLGDSLEKAGFLRSVAGDADFDRFVNAFDISTKTPAMGIFFTGAVGAGKTGAMKAVWKLLRSDNNEWVYCSDPEQVAWLRVPSSFHNQNIYLDDFGAERFKYGDDDVVGTFICAWQARNPNCRLYVTSNLTSKQIDERYGGRILDRIRDRCVICHFEGASKRREVIA